jgi:hypothetical protein
LLFWQFTTNTQLPIAATPGIINTVWSLHQTGASDPSGLVASIRPVLDAFICVDNAGAASSDAAVQTATCADEVQQQWVLQRVL